MNVKTKSNICSVGVLTASMMLFGKLCFSQEAAWDSTHRPDIFHPRVEMFNSFHQSEDDIVFIGNSITFWADWQEALRNEKIKNRGIPGDTSFGVLERLNDITKGRPSKVFLMIGINDLARNVPDDILLQNISKIVKRIQVESPRTQIFVQSILPTNNAFNKLKNHSSQQQLVLKVNQEIKGICIKEKVTFIDLNPYFSDNAGKLKKEYTWDGVHLTLAGNQAWIRVLMEQGYLIENPLDFTTQLDTISSGYDGEFNWFHPHAGVMPGNPSMILLTMQKWLISRSDVFFGLSHLKSKDYGKTWSQPAEQKQTLGRIVRGEGYENTVSDFTPKWHAASKKMLGTGHTVLYKDNHLVSGSERSTAWSVYNSDTDSWTKWEKLKVPNIPLFYSEGAGSTQRVDLPNGDILLPTYFHAKDVKENSVTVLKCQFDGKKLKYVAHGDILEFPTGRGFAEPSLAFFQDNFYLTLRNNDSGYVAKSKDGLHFSKPIVWRFDDGQDLGTYNTQQHWVNHSDGLYLVYTRRGANNDNVARNRAPLFIAKVDPIRLVILRETESILVPNTGAQLGNFGVVHVSENESWITTSEGMSEKEPTKYGADGRVYNARIFWSKPNHYWDKY